MLTNVLILGHYKKTGFSNFEKVKKLKPASTRKKFRSLTLLEVQAALCDRKDNPIKREFYRLVDSYASILEEGDEKFSNAIETLLHCTQRPAIEAMAIEFAAAINDKVRSTIPEAKIPPDTLQLIGMTTFGRQWQTPLAKTLHVADRTMRRWVEEGAPLRIGRELFAILSDHEEAIQQARNLLAELLKRPNLHLVKS